MRESSGIRALCMTLLLSALPGCEKTITHGDYAVRLIVYGTVRNESSEPLPGVTVRAFAHRNNDCTNELFMSGSATTDGAGEYRIDLNSLGRAFSACVEVSTVPEPTPPYVPIRARGVQMKETAPPDSLRTDLYLDSSALVP